ncbi:amidohydrolase [Egicoccus sp. AB-alg6-2]|uniref:amidohydrolase n=1 Tax=Egicoccus sp. AB-alg6-2 TaxID=3242692 RepID=UPI00359ED0F6
MSLHAAAPAVVTPTVLVIDRVKLPGTAEPIQVVVRDGVVAHVGPAAVVEGATERVDAEGRTVLPGLQDAHVHATQWAATRQRLDLSTATSARAVADIVADAARRAPSSPAELLVGSGFRDGLWNDRPHKSLLDAVAPGRAVVLQSADLHTAWLSSAALRLVGHGNHESGVLYEDECYRVVAALPEASVEQVDDWVLEAMAAAATRGVTGILDFEIGDCLPDWQRRAAREPLSVRVACTVYRAHLPAAIARGWRTGDVVPGSDGCLTMGPLKLFVDGSLNSRTALCHDPYPGDGGRGRLETSPDELVMLLRQAAEHGLTTAVHAIGDRATAIALDAFEQTGLPGRIEHAQLVASDDLTRFARPGLVVGVQPAHAPDDRDVADHHWSGRTSRAFPYADLLRAGATLEIGSDAPVAPLDPWDGIAAAVLRTDDARPPWHPEQCIDVRSALRAASGGRDTVAVGDTADLVLVDTDPLQVEPDGLRDPGVAATLLGGRWTHRTL